MSVLVCWLDLTLSPRRFRSAPVFLLLSLGSGRWYWLVTSSRSEMRITDTILTRTLSSTVHHKVERLAYVREHAWGGAKLLKNRAHSVSEHLRPSGHVHYNMYAFPYSQDQLKSTGICKAHQSYTYTDSPLFRLCRAFLGPVLPVLLERFISHTFALRSRDVLVLHVLTFPNVKRHRSLLRAPPDVEGQRDLRCSLPFLTSNGISLWRQLWLASSLIIIKY